MHGYLPAMYCKNKSLSIFRADHHPFRRNTHGPLAAPILQMQDTDLDESQLIRSRAVTDDKEAPRRIRWYYG